MQSVDHRDRQQRTVYISKSRMQQYTVTYIPLRHRKRSRPPFDHARRWIWRIEEFEAAVNACNCAPIQLEIMGGGVVGLIAIFEQILDSGGHVGCQPGHCDASHLSYHLPHITSNSR